MMEHKAQVGRSRAIVDKRKLLEHLLKEEGIKLHRRDSIPRADRRLPLPLSFAQQRMWFLNRLEPESPRYNITAGVRLAGPLNLDALKWSLGEIVRRHETLRTTFPTVDGRPVQLIAPASMSELSIKDLRDVPEAEREQAARQVAARGARQTFDLAGGPLVRMNLLHLADDEHIFLLTLHHIISDGWSMAVFIRELTTLYEAFSQGRPSPLPELPVQYADFAAWQRERLQGAELERQLDYWKEHLGGTTGVLNLSPRNARPATQSSNRASVSFRLPPEISVSLNAAAGRDGTTLFMILLAAFKALLQRYSRQHDILVGTPIAARPRVETEGLIGFFVNTLVMRTDLSGAPSFRELVGRVRQVALDAYGHQDIPFEKLVEELRPDRDLSHTPFFQVMFVLQNVPTSSLKLEGLTLSPYEFDPGTIMFDLALAMAETEEGLRGTFSYDADLFDAATIEGMVEHFRRILTAVATDPDRPVSEIPLLTREERERLLVEWNDTEAEYPRDRCIHELFKEQARRTPDALALIFESEQLSYGELNARANRLARYLRRLGIGPEVRVGICLERSVEMVVGLLGILKAGGAYIPLDPSYPRERLEFMLEDARVHLLLTRRRLLERLPAAQARALCVDDERDAIALESDEDFNAGASPSNPAYVIYTSGSTGQPKGVMVEHRGLCNLSEAQLHTFRLTPGSRVLQFASLSFDASIFEMVMAWRAGGVLLLATQDALAPGPGFAELLRGGNVNIVTLPPSMLATVPQVEIPSLHTIIVAGEAVSSGLVARWSAGRRFFNAYGPTEATVWSSVADCTDNKCAPDIGRPITNTRIYLLGDGLQPVPVGMAGELHIGGAGLARGYLNQPGLTAERFIPDPFGTEPGARLYRSGDLGRYLPDGRIEFLGRADRQVKIRGFRIEPEEIAAVLNQHPSVLESVALPWNDVQGEARLVAYVVAGEAERPGNSELRDFLKAKLPDYMIPSAFIMLDALPLSPNGKLDKDALPAPDGMRPELESSFVASRNPTEEVMAGLWAGLIGLERVGVNDNFFSLGGHSLLAAQIVSRIRDVFGVELPLRALLENPTVAVASSKVEAARREAGGLRLPQMTPVPRTGGQPLSFAQQRMWFLDQLAPGNHSYNIPTAFHLTGPLDAAALERALDEIVRRHEILRTTFPAAQGQPRQVIAPELKLNLARPDLRNSNEGELRRLATQEARRPFDLERGPLLRVTLLRLGAQEHAVLLTMHHIVSDAWSMGLFVHELTTLYEAFSQGRPSPLPELPVQYADFAAWQREFLKGEALETQISYWRQSLEGAPPLLELPTDRPRPAVQSFSGTDISFALGRELSQALKSLSQRENVTLFMLLLAVFKTLLYRYCGQEDIVVGTPVANRTRAETEGLIGFFINTLVLRTDLSGHPTFRELLGRVREVALGAYAHQDLPFERLVEELQPERDTSHAPLFQVSFALQNAPVQFVKTEGLSLSAVATESDTTHFDLGFSMTETGEGLTGSVQYSLDLFERSTIERMIGHFRTLLEAIVADPQRRVSELPLLSDHEREQLLGVWSVGPRVAYPRELGVHRLFEFQAEQTADALALVCGGERLSYGELNRRANRLAHHLRSLGVGPEVRVGIYLERSLDMAVALFGVLKAGGAYVPLDPSHPHERIAFILNDAKAAVLLTQCHLAERLANHQSRAVLLDADREAITANPDFNPESLTTGESLACMIYTSGTTGRPKGVMLEHGGITNIIFTSMDKFDFTSSDVLPSIAALSFDISLFELVTPLLAGGSSIILKRDEALDLERLTRLLDEATLLHTVPSLMRRLVTFLRENGLDLGGYKNIKRIFIGGDLVPPDLLREMQEIFASSQINVLYGPTEGTIICATHPVEKGRTPERHVIGRPLPNALLRLYDRDGNLVPVGVPGEIYVGGPGLSRGYFNRDELTSQKYVTIDGERFYRTGDLGRWLSDGNIEFLGRIDDQVKIRGNRVELNEVEAVLSQHPAVREAAVVARQDARQEKHLIAFVSANGGQQPTVGSLRSFIAERLPDYMIPSAFTLLDALPLTPHGKVDRRALQTLGGQGAELGEAYVAPQTELEQTIARIWREVLGVERVGTNDSFFDLGGHSLLIIQVHARLKEAISREVAVVDLFKFPTISALASHLSERREDSTTFEKVRERASQRRAAASNRQKIKRRGVGGHE